MYLHHLWVNVVEGKSYLVRPHWACSAGLKNTVSADCCERKILFWQDVNSDFVRWLTSRQSASQPAEHAHYSQYVSTELKCINAFD